MISSLLLNYNLKRILFLNNLKNFQSVFIYPRLLYTGYSTEKKNSDVYYQTHIQKGRSNILSAESISYVSKCNLRHFSNAASSGPENDNSSKPERRALPRLMMFPEIIWPSILKSIKNWILIQFIIRPYFDQEFNLQDFVVGTKQALKAVSAKLSEGDLTSLSGLVSSDALTELKAIISKMSVAQRTELHISKEDVYFYFPYQVGIILDESNERIQKRWVEITMVFHALRGLKEMLERGESPPLNISSMPEFRDKVYICNYRFIKEFTKGNESDWTINIINHFKVSDFLEE